MEIREKNVPASVFFYGIDHVPITPEREASKATNRITARVARRSTLDGAIPHTKRLDLKSSSTGPECPIFVPLLSSFSGS
jgi:hypothetical protein